MRDDKLYLQDIIKEIDFLQQMSGEVTYDGLVQDEIRIRAVERSFEIIGEAASRISATLKSQHDDVEWVLMKDMRNIIAHDYFQVDYTIVWETILSDLPELKNSLDKILRTLVK